MLKRISMILIIIIFSISCSGCAWKMLPERTEINDLNMIRVVGIDKGIKDPNNICVTLLSKKQQQEGGKKGGQSGGAEDQGQGVVISSESPTFLDTEQQFQTYSDKQIFLGHVDYFLIGEETAKEDLDKYIDYISREHDIRGNAKIYVVKNSTANEFMEKIGKSDYFLPDRLKAIGGNSYLQAGPQEVTLLNFLENMNSKHSAIVVPVLNLKPAEGKQKASEDTKVDLDLGGYAAIKNFKLVCLLDKDLVRGENFLLDRVRAGDIQVQEPNGNMIGLDIIESLTEISTFSQNGELQGMKVKVQVSSNVNEVQTTENIFTEKTLDYLTSEQSNLVQAEIERVIQKAQEQDDDFIDMANLLQAKHPVLWEKYKNQWEEIFPTLPITVEVQSRINRTYDIREPNGISEEEYK